MQRSFASLRMTELLNYQLQIASYKMEREALVLASR
jgi:hypothetical protein